MPRGDAVAGPIDAGYLVLKRRVWMFRRRVPRLLRHLDPRAEVRLSTGTGDRTKAALAAAHFNAALEAHWASLLADPASTGDAAARFEAAVGTARKLGLRYQPAAALAETSLEAHRQDAQNLCSRRMRQLLSPRGLPHEMIPIMWELHSSGDLMV